MFEKLFTASKNSPFSSPFDRAQCETKVNSTRTIHALSTGLFSFNWIENVYFIVLKFNFKILYIQLQSILFLSRKFAWFVESNHSRSKVNFLELYQQSNGTQFRTITYMTNTRISVLPRISVLLPFVIISTFKKICNIEINEK